MIRRSPAEYYIKYLLLHPDKYDDDDIKRILREHQLDFPYGGYLDRLRAGLKMPTPFYPFNENHKASYRLLVKERVHTLFHPNEHMCAALEILKTPRAKELVESMGIVEDPLALTATRLQRAGIGTYTIEALKLYVHYFWNTKLVDSLELRSLVSKRAEEASLEGGEGGDLITQKSLIRAQYSDPRYNAVNAPSQLMASLLLQIRFGYMPSKVDTVRIAEMAATLAAAGALDAGMVGGPKAAASMRDYALAAASLSELQRSLGAPNTSVTKELHQMAVQTSMDAVPHIDSLTRGDYSDGFVLTEGTDVSSSK